MSLRAGVMGSVPVETARVARAAFPKGSPAMRLRDALGPLFRDAQFVDLFPKRGKPGLSPALLTMVSVLQYCEGLTDRQAVQAMAGRIDWKYALGVELTDTGCDFSVLSEFRDRLVAQDAGVRILDTILDAAREKGLVKKRGRARTDSTHVVGAIRQINRLGLVGESLRAALEQLADAAPEWLTEHADLDWFDRYGRRIEMFQLPAKDTERAARAARVGADGMRLWQLLTSTQAPAGLAHLERVELLRRVWVQEYHVTDGIVVMRDPKDRPPAGVRLVSPYDPDARTGKKRHTYWDGYTLHVTETCDPGLPRLVTHVATTSASVTDVETTEVVHEGLSGRGLLPGEHVVDAGYVTAHTLTRSAARGVRVVGPVLPDTTWQTTTARGYAAADFRVDWGAGVVTCPRGKHSTGWAPRPNRHGTPTISVSFPAEACRPCPVRELCTTSVWKGRTLTLLPRPEHEALTRARLAQRTDTWQDDYRSRAGIEGTLNQAVNTLGARRARYRGLAKTHLQHHFTAAALNFIRIDNHLTGRPLAPTRVSTLAALKPAA
ncbi:IS1182 family transposase [Actinocrispum wychmicini]|uniref:Transposase n=1 Tax=Actinocrispum wychmicini TaxID=1213861 RepID=A0A4R2J861_9PSEU|nr:IS1182 family transposase [Actinocrispum wychmicini]TCO54794.1 transposase [Actinocrispum wychmicini]